MSGSIFDTPFLGLAVYLALIAWVAVRTLSMNDTKEAFILGGRRLGAWVIAFSERTAAESSWLILGLSGAFFASGLIEVWTVLGCVGGIIFYWFAVAGKLRVVSEEKGAITLPEYFVQVSGPYGRRVRAAAMLIITFFFSFYVAAQFKGAEKMIAVTFGIESGFVMPAAAAVVVLYTLMGGFAAVCYTDVVQAILMLVTLVFMPIAGFVFIAKGGLSVSDALAAAGNAGSLLGGKTGWAAFAAVIGGLSWGLGYMGQPHLVTKFMAIRTADDIKKSRSVAVVWTVLAYAGAALVGIVGITLIHHGAAIAEGMAEGGNDPERILPVLASALFPAWIAGILIAGAVAAMMSTADSQLLIAASTIVEDFYCKALRRTLSQKGLVRMSRAVTAAVGLAALLIAASSDNLIYDVVSMAWAGLGASFGPALLLSLHWKRMNGRGILFSMVTGAGATVLWTLVPALNEAVSVRFAAFALSLAAAILGSLNISGKIRAYGI